ncbi:MAG: hypothetical protein ABIM74_07110, partial [candidate division WOR-3 bacterium]
GTMFLTEINLPQKPNLDFMRNSKDRPPKDQSFSVKVESKFLMTKDLEGMKVGNIRAGRLEGIKVGMWLLDNIRIHWLGEDELREIMRLAEAPDEPRLSLVDWALVYLARQENACVFTYDDKMRETDIRILS